jgi:hypothetical protein
MNTIGRKTVSIRAVDSLTGLIDLLCKLGIADVVCIAHWEVKPQLMIFGNGVEIRDESSIYAVELELYEGVDTYLNIRKRPITRRLYVNRR